MIIGARFLREVQEQTKTMGSTGYHTVVLKAPHGDWVKLSRDRTAVCWAVLGGKFTLHLEGVQG